MRFFLKWLKSEKRTRRNRERKKKSGTRGCGINGIAEPKRRLWVKYFPASVFSFVYSTTQIFPLARFANAFLLRRFTEESGGHGWADRLYPLDLSSWETAGSVTLCNYGATTKLRSSTSFSYLPPFKLCT